MASLARAAGDFATLVELLPRAPDSAILDPAALRQQLLGLLEQFARAAAAAGGGAGDIEQARFALVAWADERVLRSRWWGREEWQRHSLQLQLYQTENAGKEFFERLARLGPASRAREVFFLALALGFEGQYAGSGAERQALIEDQFARLRAAGAALELGREPRLAPAAYRLRIERSASGGRRGIGRTLLALAAIAFAAYGGLWLLLRLLAPALDFAAGI